jgi:hypothetical protein
MYLCRPDERDAYVCPVQYVIGDDLMAAPFIMPINTGRALQRSPCGARRVVKWCLTGTLSTDARR